MSGSPAYLTEEWVTTKDAAKHFGRTIRTIRRWINDGTFEHFGFEVQRELRGQIRIHLTRKEKPGVTNVDKRVAPRFREL